MYLMTHATTTSHCMNVCFGQTKSIVLHTIECYCFLAKGHSQSYIPKCFLTVVL